MSVLRLTPGVVFAGDFEIVGPLAEGGMGAVYVARQLSTGKERALKIMRASLANDRRTRERFIREARAGSQVDSEHVVEVVAAGIDAETGIPWLAMELLRGEDLGAFAERVGPLPPAQTLEIFRQLCHGLAAAHAAGLVHRDLKPENVFLATARRVGVPFTVKLLDFGIAKVVQETKHEVTDAVGTPTWMAPEQTESGRVISPAADVWSLGLIAFRLLTGRYYWRCANQDDVSAMAILREVVFETMEPASVRARALGSPVGLSTAFDGWFARAVVRDPEKRFPNATAALHALEPVLGAGLSPGGAPRGADLPAPPATVRGEPFVSASSASSAAADLAAASTLRPDLPATRVGPFTQAVSIQQAPTPQTSLPPPEDVDSYQERISGPRWWAWGLAVAVLGGVVYGGVRLRERLAAPAPFRGLETEPNNRAPEANSVPYGQQVRATLGQRFDAKRSDRDFFRVAVPQGGGLVRLAYGALPNIAPCVLVYRSGRDEPILRYCVGQPGRSLVVPALRLEPADYLLAVLQDTEQYTEDPPPPVLENISDAYELEMGPAEAVADFEVEPNDQRGSGNPLGPGQVARGRLSWMRDVDVFCTEAAGGPVRFVVEDPSPRARGAVLQVTPLGGPGDAIPVRVHHSGATGEPTERDVRGSWTSPPVESGPACVSLTLTQDIWSSPPLPRVAPAGDAEYVVRALGS